jgi:hypothetical protein
MVVPGSEAGTANISPHATRLESGPHNRWRCCCPRVIIPLLEWMAAGKFGGDEEPPITFQQLVRIVCRHRPKCQFCIQQSPPLHGIEGSPLRAKGFESPDAASEYLQQQIAAAEVNAATLNRVSRLIAKVWNKSAADQQNVFDDTVEQHLQLKHKQYTPRLN